jgi:hypothetical protein
MGFDIVANIRLTLKHWPGTNTVGYLATNALFHNVDISNHKTLLIASFGQYSTYGQLFTYVLPK